MEILRGEGANKNALLGRGTKAKFEGWGPGGGGTLIFHTYVGSVHFLGFEILNFNIFWGFQKNEYFFGVLRFC